VYLLLQWLLYYSLAVVHSGSVAKDSVICPLRFVGPNLGKKYFLQAKEKKAKKKRIRLEKGG